MSALLFSLLIAAIICGWMWKSPASRAAVSGAWNAGAEQARVEFREGYQYAQAKLREGNPRLRNPKRWLSWALAGAWGAGHAIGATGRIVGSAANGGRKRYSDWKAAQPVEAEVVEEVETEVEQPLVFRCSACGQDGAWFWGAAVPPAFYCRPCGTARVPAPEPAEAHEDEQGEDQQDQQPEPIDPEQHDNPDSQEEPEMQHEAAGLTSYAAAYTGLASEARERMSGVEGLASSMASILAEHSHLIGEAAVIQDLLNQVAGRADALASAALTVANN